MPESGSTAWPNADTFETPATPGDVPLGDDGDTARTHAKFHADLGAAWEAMRADSRWTNTRAPSGAASGVLSGTYPNPGFAADMATQAELDAHAAAGDPHPVYETSTEAAAKVTAHEAASDPHTGYQKESEKGSASGYAGLDAGSRVAQSPKLHASEHALGGADALTDIGAPGLIVPPAATFGDVADNAWFAANNWCAMRFYLPVKCTMRYGLLWITTPSGNVQMAVVRLSGANRLGYTRVMDSGILLASGISVVDGGAARLDMGATALTPGDYALVVWADNTTVKIPNSTSDHVESTRLNAGGNNAGGVQASGTFPAWNSRYVMGAALEADV